MSIRKVSALASLLGAASILATVAASATPLSVVYNGGTFTLDGSSVSSSNCGGASNCYAVTYTADFSGFSSANQNYFDAIAFNANGSTFDYAAENGGSDTVVMDNGLSANGCSSKSPDKWVCATLSTALATTGTDSFNFYVALSSGTFDFGDSSLKMLFFTSSDLSKSSGLMSCNATECPGTSQVPEPATLALFAAGLGGLGFALSRRRKNV